MRTTVWLDRAIAAMLIAIATSLFLGGRLAPIVSRVVADDVFVFGFAAIVIGAVVTALLRGVTAGRVATLLLVAGVWMLAASRIVAPIERSHLFEYGALTVLVARRLAVKGTPRPRLRGWSPPPALVAAVVVAAVGIVDEALQLVLPARVFDWEDVAFNVGAAVGAAASLALVDRLRPKG